VKDPKLFCWKDKYKWGVTNGRIHDDVGNYSKNEIGWKHETLVLFCIIYCASNTKLSITSRDFVCYT